MIGRKPYPDNKYEIWLNDMAPFLKSGMSVYKAIEKAGLLPYKDSIYRKYRLKDWFCEKITIFQSYPGELVNGIFAQRIIAMYDQVMRGEPLARLDVKLLCFVATRHRSCQPFFVQRHEVVKSTRNNLEKTLNALETGPKAHSVLP